MRLLRAFALIAGVAVAATASAAPHSIGDCEKIEAPLAYNECLASFGPAVGHTGGGGSRRPPADDAPPAHGPGVGKRHGGPNFAGTTIRRGSSGRIHMEFIPRR